MKGRRSLGSVKALLQDPIEEVLVAYPVVRPLAPTTDYPTDYDQMHISTYLILERESKDAPWEYLARRYLRATPEVDREKAKACYDSHLARALWFNEVGRWLFMEHGPQPDDEDKRGEQVQRLPAPRFPQA